jgi:transcriptional regulator with XRE-family HTH domain
VTHGRSSAPRDASSDKQGNDAATKGSGAEPLLESVREMIAARLRAARELAGLSQGQVAKLMKLHRPTISEIEAGRRRVSADELRELAQHYRTSVGWLTGEEGEVIDPRDDRIRLAARELGKLSQEDLDRVLRVLATVRARGTSSE